LPNHQTTKINKPLNIYSKLKTPKDKKRYKPLSTHKKMKILAIGDFHGRLNIPLKRIIKEEKIDLILSTGDYSGEPKINKIISEYKKEEIPKSKIKLIEKLEEEAIKKGIVLLKEIKKLNIPFFGVRGNWDPTPYPWDIGGDLRKTDKKYYKRINSLKSNNFSLIDFKLVNLKDFIIIGGASSTHPARITKESLKGYDESEKRLRKKEYNRRKKIYEKNFIQAKKLKKPIIFLTHNTPYKTKLDTIKIKYNNNKILKEHYGSYLEKEIIKRFKPLIVISGHIHENQGKDKIKETTLINPGAVLDNKYSIINLNEKNNKIKEIKFIK
jgi:Icc-related predicted phosphoesterase